MLPTYASHRSQPPATGFTVSSIAGAAASQTRNFYIQYANRAGRSLLSDFQTVTGTGAEVTLDSSLILAIEEVFWIVISCETTGLDTDAAILCQWQAREPNQITRRSLPATIQFTTDEHFENNRSYTTIAQLPTTGILAGAIAYVAATNKYYRYDPEAYRDADQNLISYGTNYVDSADDYWIDWDGNFDAYINETTDFYGSDRIISSVENALAVPPKLLNIDSVPLRYWFNNGLEDDGGSLIVDGKYSFDITADGTGDYTTVFSDKINYTLIGYLDRDTMILDTSMQDVGVVQVWNPTDGLIHLPVDLPRNHAAVYDIVLTFDNDDLLGVLSTNNPLISLDITEVYAVRGQVSELAKILGDIVLSEGDKMLIVPGPKRLSGRASFAVGYLVQDTNEQVIAGLLPDVANQQAVMVGSLNGFVNIKQPGIPLEYSEAIRAVVSTAPGLSKLIASNTLFLSSNGIEIVVEHPVDANGLGTIRLDYFDPYLAGMVEVEFTPTEAYAFLDYNGVFYQSGLLLVSQVTTETYTFADITEFTQIPSLPPIVSDPEFSLFEPVTVTASAVAGTMSAGNATIYFGYQYVSPNSTLTKINHLATNAVPTLNTTLAQAINNNLLVPNNLSDVPDKAIARTNLDVYDTAYVDNHINDTNNPHQITAAAIGAASQTDLDAIESDVIDNTNDIISNDNDIATNATDIALLYSKEDELTTDHIVTDADFRTILSFNSPTDVVLFLDETTLTALPNGIFEVIARKTGAGNVNISVAATSTFEAAGTQITDLYESAYLAYVDNNKWIGLGNLS